MTPNKDDAAQASLALPPCSAALASPALKQQSINYPPRYRGRVPWKIKMACTVRPDFEQFCERRGTVAVMDEVYECWVNMHGAVAAICRNGEKLGVKPAEFDVVEWHKPNGTPRP